VPPHAAAALTNKHFYYIINKCSAIFFYTELWRLFRARNNRQSTLAQVRHHHESTERQYALKDKALALGWTETAIRTLDRDLGQSGTQMTAREDFKTLVADVSMGQVGAVFALEVSRLARSNLDWHRLLELCALTHTLVID
jgi:DNA invertase Pin-like site-specific DNA recombinase